MIRKLKVLLFILLIVGQIILFRYVHQLKLYMDLFYLILVYVSVMGGFYKSIAVACVIGLVTDYFSPIPVMGVFGFSRTLAAFVLNEISRRIDLKNNIFIFLLITISLALSNLVACIFLYFIAGFSISLTMVLYQPVLTGLVGLAITAPKKAKMYLDVY
jgi:rod shape-determining protein MreD